MNSISEIRKALIYLKAETDKKIAICNQKSTGTNVVEAADLKDYVSYFNSVISYLNLPPGISSENPQLALEINRLHLIELNTLIENNQVNMFSILSGGGIGDFFSRNNYKTTWLNKLDEISRSCSNILYFLDVIE